MEQIITELSNVTNGNLKEIAIVLLLAVVRFIEKRRMNKTAKKD